ncbi:MAG TPA: GreA/GreB family elongation factor [Sphingomicrobium sp.]|jgi:transcription elongation GreA/GreB family factor
MSVAFRRESDEEHLEPKFALPIPPGPNLVTPRGFAMIQERHDALEARLATELPEDERKSVLREAQYWRSRLTSAQLAPAPAGDQVAIGTRVTIERDGREQTLDIVGHDESDPGAGRISFASPLGRALLGAEAGDDVELAGSGDPIAIVSIEAASEG